jgi:ABC-type polar amino acid transport system ATPase subunit
MALKVERLAKRHPGASFAALEDVTFEVPGGACVSLLGRSGAGKSTLLRCLVGLDSFDSGEIVIDGVRVAATDRGGAEATLTRLRGRTGLVFQSFELFPHLSILDNCTLAPVKVRGRTRAEAQEKARVLLEQLGLSDKADSHPESLSGGQRQRAAIARALAMEPRVLFYDEPTSALDPSLRNELRRTLDGVGALGITQVVVTHDFEFAREATQLAFVLAAGRIARSGPAPELLADE